MFKSFGLLTGLILANLTISINHAHAQSISLNRLYKMSCQELSNEFGIWHNKSWGDAHSETVRKYWIANNCTTRPSGMPSCQQLSNTYEVFHNVSWGSAGKTQQNMWSAMGCTTRPR